jgi:hypothetical protein
MRPKRVTIAIFCILMSVGSWASQESTPLLTSADIIAKIGTEADAHHVFVTILTHAMANRSHREFFLASQIRSKWLPALKGVEFVRLADTEIARHLSSCGQYWFIDRLERADKVISVWLNQRCGGTALYYVVSFDGRQWQLGSGPGIASGFAGPPPGCPCLGRRN